MNLANRSLLLLALAVGTPANAQRDPSGCVGIADDAARLRCYDAAFGRTGTASSQQAAGSTAAAPTAAPAASPAATAKAAPQATTGPAATAAAASAAGAAAAAGGDAEFGMNQKLNRDKNEAEGKAGEAKEITSKVTRAQRSPDGRYTVWLDNGQSWRQIDIVQHLSFAAGDSVTIRRTFSGSYLLRNNAANRAGYARRLE